ncbi:sulfate adenylyltransferase subunit 1 [Comamonas sp. NLF-1-9]|uniref:sulfate adenylyltransferase subunit 1 n=1 Tax=Comamonas sp. NLF-1-9 TaxID=2853163 RepID=UPI001C475100|nr:GTP-binding protein [Comamonas sp. NLF-1-9]QXL84405.1 sulfate adenylyltransferase [Comamonas sp. NLF-1-9]
MNAINDLWPEARNKGVLRLVTAGSVDDGKSTLIGRLLLDSKGVFADQLSAISGSRYSRAPADALDLALLTDGLEAEREQGITIDVAYRYFATPARKFIIADAPGHEQYTRNMVTGASTADAAVLLIDAARAQGGELLPQTKRHATLAQLLGLRHVVIAINKMDQVQWDPAVYQRIRTAVEQLAQRLGMDTPHCVPLSALTGDNVVQPSPHMPWYAGQPLLALLESLPLDRDAAAEQGSRLFVQWVIRHEGSTTHAFRGYAGQVQGGPLRAGDVVTVLPSGETAQVQAIQLGEQALQIAAAGDSVTVVLDREIDVSRGDLLVTGANSPRVAREFEADLCWLDRQALNPARWYWLKQGARLTQARITAVTSKRDISELRTVPHDGPLASNDIGRVRLRTRDALALDDYDKQQSTGAFILIDDASHQTAAAGMVRLAN